jgi:L-ascorbate metabolism protein UlaG (beta-lactamase superfamily)
MYYDVWPHNEYYKMKVSFLLLGVAAIAAIALCTDQPDFFSTESGPVRTTPIYGASLLVEGRGKAIYIDPVSKGNYKGLPKADLILITSDRPGHYDPEGVAKVLRKNTSALAPASIASKLQHSTPIGNDETVQFGDISISAVPAYHDDTDKGKANGYVFTFPGLRLYISGDTANVPELKQLKKVEIAFLAVGPPDAMSLADGAAVIGVLKARIIYPYHFGQTPADDLRKQLATPGTEIRIREWY